MQLDLSNVHIIDYIVLSFIAFHAIMGLFKGFLSTTINFVKIVTIIIVIPILIPIFSNYIKHQYSTIIIAVILFIIAIILFKLLNILSKKFIKFSSLGTIDNILGLFFGSLKGLIYVSLILILVNKISLLFNDDEDYFINKEARTYGIVKFTAIILERSFPILSHKFDGENISSFKDIINSLSNDKEENKEEDKKTDSNETNNQDNKENLDKDNPKKNILNELLDVINDNNNKEDLDKLDIIINKKKINSLIEEVQ